MAQPFRQAFNLAIIGALVGWCSGCGGGGGGGNAAPASVDLGPGTPPSAQVATYGTGTLPGAILVNKLDGDAVSYQLGTGAGVSLPKRPDGRHEEIWEMGAARDVIVLADGDSVFSARPISFCRTSDWQKVMSELTMPQGVGTVLLSKDKKYLLTFWRDPDTDERLLTVFDAVTGAVVKRGSALDGESPNGVPAAWLPDGRYVFLKQNIVYVSSPSAGKDTVLFTMNKLPHNDQFHEGFYALEDNALAVSPDGDRLAFVWSEWRGNIRDKHIWVVNLNGGTDLHRLTAPPDPNSGVTYSYVSPHWAPNSQYVAGVLSMAGSNTAPVFPDSPDGLWQVVGTTGCNSPVFALPVASSNVALTWPRFDERYGIKVASATNARQGTWLSLCGGQDIEWLD